MVGMAAAETSFGHAGVLLRELAGVEVDAKQVERHAEALGRDIARDEAEVVEPESAAAATLYVGLDGTGVPIADGYSPRTASCGGGPLAIRPATNDGSALGANRSLVACSSATDHQRNSWKMPTSLGSGLLPEVGSKRSARIR